MTEEEAKTRWCPMVRVGSSLGTTINRGVREPLKSETIRETCCIGSACMMWRKDNEWDATTGYCGLAGNPT